MDDSTKIRNLQRQLREVRKELQVTQKMLQEEFARKSISIESTFDAEKAMLGSSNHADLNDEKGNESLPSKSGFQLDIMNPVVTGNYQSEYSDKFNSEEFLGSSQGTTTGSSIEHNRTREEESALPTAPDSTEGSQTKIEPSTFLSITKNNSFDGNEGKCSTLSLNIRSQLSNPETIYGLHGVGSRAKSVFRSQDYEASGPNGRLENNISWDAVAYGTESFVENEQAFRTIESLNDKSWPLIPAEITIINGSTIEGNRCLTDRLKDAEARIEFLEEKLESSDNIIEAGFRDLQRARFCIRDLVQRNTEMKVKLKRKRREDIKENYEKGEIMVEQYWILKLSLYGSVFFFLSGSQEYFLASAFFVWLTLEMNITA